MMPVGLGKDFLSIPAAETRAVLEAHFGPLSPAEGPTGNGPAEYCLLPGFRGRIGFISALSHKFCQDCNRVRLTATGFLKTCLQFSHGADLREPLRAGATDQELLARMAAAIRAKPSAHHFDGPFTQEDERRNMSQIGG